MNAMDRRAFLRATLGAAGAVALSSCGGGSKQATAPAPPAKLLRADELRPVPRPTIRVPGSDFGLPSPFAYLPPTYGLLSYIYDSLLLEEADNSMLPWLATRHDASPDGLRHAFELRDNVRWQDGRPFGPDDVVFSFEYFKSQEEAGFVAPWVIFKPDHIARVRATGPRQVEILLDKPVVTFTRAVAGRFPIVPKHIWSKVPVAANVTQDLAVLVGTGPYRLRSYVGAEGSYLFTANDEFFLGRPFVRRIELVPVGDALAALRTGDVDAAGVQVAPTSGRVVASFEADPEFGVVRGDPDFTTALYWNLGRGGPLNDVRFRRACAHAIDREDLIERVLGRNGGVPGNPGYLAPKNPYRVDVEQYPFNLDAANALLDEAGYRRGKRGLRQTADGKPLRFQLQALPDLTAAAQFVVQALKRVGVELKVSPLTDPFRLGDDYEMALFVYGSPGGDPDILRAVYSSRIETKGFLAAQGYANPEVDDLAERQLVTRDDGERRRLVARIQHLVAADLPLLHLYYPRPFFVFRRSVFDQWGSTRGGGPTGKRGLVTGVGSGGLEIRPSL